MTEAELVNLLGQARVDLTDEKRTQAQLAEHLTKNGVAFEREVRLTAGNIVDFLVGGVAIEVKLRRWKKRAVFKQLERYAKCERVRALILATNLSMGLPPEIEGKPAYYVSLGRAWL